MSKPEKVKKTTMAEHVRDTHRNKLQGSVVQSTVVTGDIVGGDVQKNEAPNAQPREDS